MLLWQRTVCPASQEGKISDCCTREAIIFLVKHLYCGFMNNNKKKSQQRNYITTYWMGQQNNGSAPNKCLLSICPSPSLATHTFGISSVCLHSLHSLACCYSQTKVCMALCVLCQHLLFFFFPLIWSNRWSVPSFIIFSLLSQPSTLKLLYILFYLCNFQQKFGLHINTYDSLTLHLLLLNVSS